MTIASRPTERVVSTQTRSLASVAMRVPPAVLALAVCTGLAVVLFAGAWARPTKTFIGGDGDPQLFVWNLVWQPFGLTHGPHRPLFTKYIDYPVGVNLMWNAWMVAPSLVLWPVTTVFGPILAYNLMLTLGMSLSGWCAFLALRQLGSSVAASLVGGLLYEFSPYMLPQIGGHPHVGVAIFPPLVLMLLHHICVLQKRRAVVMGGLLGLAAAVQLLTGEELLATTAMMGVFGVLVLVVLRRREVRQRTAYVARAIGSSAAVFLVLAAYPLKVQYTGPQQVHGILQTPNTFVNDLYAFVIPNVWQHFAPSAAINVNAHFTGNMAETNAYLGFPLLLSVPIMALILRRHSVAVWATIMTLIAVVLSLGPELHANGRLTGIQLPWSLIGNRAPLWNIIPSRLMVFGYLGIAILVALFMDAAWRSGGARRVTGLLAMAFALAPLVPAYPYPTFEPPLPSFFTAGAQEIPEGSVALVVPFASASVNSRAMLWQAESGMRFRMPEGEAFIADPQPSLDPPPSLLQTILTAYATGHPAPPLTADNARELTRELRLMSVQSIVVGPFEGRGDADLLFSNLLGRPAERVEGVDLWTGVG